MRTFSILFLLLHVSLVFDCDCHLCWFILFLLIVDYYSFLTLSKGDKNMLMFLVTFFSSCCSFCFFFLYAMFQGEPSSTLFDIIKKGEIKVHSFRFHMFLMMF